MRGECQCYSINGTFRASVNMQKLNIYIDSAAVEVVHNIKGFCNSYYYFGSSISGLIMLKVLELQFPQCCIMLPWIQRVSCGLQRKPCYYSLYLFTFWQIQNYIINQLLARQLFPDYCHRLLTPLQNLPVILKYSLHIHLDINAHLLDYYLCILYIFVHILWSIFCTIFCNMLSYLYCTFPIFMFLDFGSTCFFIFPVLYVEKPLGNKPDSLIFKNPMILRQVLKL